MDAFTQHRGLVALMDRANVDTDQIIPKQFLKRIERTGFGQYLFFDWRFADDGTDKPDFELNNAAFQGASILIARRNFGCGSSREHAVWALADYGFRVVIAPSFADIFYNNCFKNAVLPVVLEETQIDKLFQRVQQQPGYELAVDLENQTVIDDCDAVNGDAVYPFEVDASRRHCMLNGLDDIAMTLQHADRIQAYESARGI